jgi:CHAD domain-containing protein
LSGYVREAQALLKLAPVPDDKTVHDVRVLMKKSRAVMRLISSQVDEETFNRNYDAFREVGRVMCSWRETSVHRKILKELKKMHSDVFEMLKENAKLDRLMKKDEAPPEAPPAIKDDLEKIDELLGKAGYRIRFQSMESFDPKLLIKELDSTYNIVVDKYLKCRNNPRPANLHEFRKRAKDFLYQLYFFRPLNPPVLKGLEKKLDAMTQCLGKCNDLTQLLATIEYKFRDPSNTPAMDELMVVIREAQDNYLSKVWPVAYKIFCPGQKLVNVLGFRILMI